MKSARQHDVDREEPEVHPDPPSSTVDASLTTVALGPVGLRLRDEVREERVVLAGLGVPLDADGEALRRVLDGLERPVRGPRRLDEAVPEARERLMVVRGHLGVGCRPSTRGAFPPSPRPGARRTSRASACARRCRWSPEDAGRGLRRGRRSAAGRLGTRRASAHRARAPPGAARARPGRAAPGARPSRGGRRRRRARDRRRRRRRTRFRRASRASPRRRPRSAG